MANAFAKAALIHPRRRIKDTWSLNECIILPVQYECLIIRRVDVEALACCHDGIRYRHHIVRVVDALEIALAGHGDALHLWAWLKAELGCDFHRQVVRERPQVAGWEVQDGRQTRRVGQLLNRYEVPLQVLCGTRVDEHLDVGERHVGKDDLRVGGGHSLDCDAIVLLLVDELLAEIDSLTKEEKEEMEEGIELPRIGVDKAEYEAMLKDAGITDPNVLQKVLYKFLALATKNKEGETVSLGAKDSVSINREAKEMEETITELRSELNEVNLLNAKLLYTNKIFKSKNLTESEKVKVLNTFDKAETVKPFFPVHHPYL